MGTGFIGIKYVLVGAEPLTYLAIRMALVMVLMAIVAGILVRGLYLGSTAIAIAHLIRAGLSALIPGLQPILTSTLASRFLGERVTPLQGMGLLYWLYLVSAVTAVMAHGQFGERLAGVAIAGMVACSAAVFLVNRGLQGPATSAHKTVAAK